MAERTADFPLPDADDLFKKPKAEGHLRHLDDTTPPPLTKVAEGQLYHEQPLSVDVEATANPVQMIAELVDEPSKTVQPKLNPFDDDLPLIDDDSTKTTADDDALKTVESKSKSESKSESKTVQTKRNPFDDDDDSAAIDHSETVKTTDDDDFKTVQPKRNPFDDDSSAVTDSTVQTTADDDSSVENADDRLKTVQTTSDDRLPKAADVTTEKTDDETAKNNDETDHQPLKTVLTTEKLDQNRQDFLNDGQFVKNDRDFTPPPFSNQVTITVQAAVYPINQTVVSSDELPKITEQKIDQPKATATKNNGFTNLGIDYRNGLSKTAQQFAKALLMLQASLKILWSLMLVVVVCGSLSFLFILRFGGVYTTDQIIGGSIFDCLTVVVLSVYGLIRLLADRHSFVRYLKNFYDTRNSIKILMKWKQNDQYFDKFNQQLTIGYGGQLADTDF